MVNHKEGWNPEGFRGRYSEVLDRYDYIVGDWGYSQLRLKGFYRDNHPKANRDTVISGLIDYINEYCNFGCAYFVLRKMKDAPKDPDAKDILVKEPGEASKEIPGKGPVSQTAAAREEGIPQISSRKFQAESAVSKEVPSREYTSKDRPAKDRGRDNRNRDYQGRKGPRENQSRDHQSRDNHPKSNPSREYQSRDAQGRGSQQRPPQGPSGPS